MNACEKILNHFKWSTLASRAKPLFVLLNVKQIVHLLLLTFAAFGSFYRKHIFGKDSPGVQVAMCKRITEARARLKLGGVSGPR